MQHTHDPDPRRHDANREITSSNDNDYKYLFKIVIVGDTGVGKTCILRQFTDGVFTHRMGATLGVDFKVKTVNDGDDTIKLQLWDTSGLERFRSITTSYYRNARALIVVYDMSWYRSFENLASWLAEIERYADQPMLTVLVGDKLDLERQVPCHHGQRFAQAHNFDYFIETSARDATNVQLLFDEVAKRLNKMEDQSVRLVRRDQQ